MGKIGVFICHCGTNISAGIDIDAVVEAAKLMPNVVLSVDYKYMCSEPGQSTVKNAVAENELDGVVIGACSPRMHELTFRKALQDTRLNPYMMEIANLREQCAWAHKDKMNATDKAIDLIRMAVAKVARNKPLYTSTIPVTKKALVIGGGIAGLQAALDIADAGHKVVLVEKDQTIGGKMAMLDKTFPTLDCSA